MFLVVEPITKYLAPGRVQAVLILLPPIFGRAYDLRLSAHGELAQLVERLVRNDGGLVILT